MLSTLIIISFVIAVKTTPGSCCRSNEYEARDGECCPMCQEGTVVRKDCTSLSGTRCARCDNGTFMNQLNGLHKCFSCSSCDQGHGLFVQQECTETRDTVCEVSKGFFCTRVADDAGCSQAEKHSQCEAGQRIKEPGTSRADTLCEPCPPGYFSHQGVNCTAWTRCSEAQTRVKEGSTVSDVVCAAASRNHYSYIPVLLAFVTLVLLLITGRLQLKTNE